jgi:hypothetical protein
MRYIHLKCLQEYIKVKCKIISNEHCTTYIWENLFCEICKEKYPDFLVRKHRRIKILEFSLPEEGPYIMLESFQKHDDK